MLSTIKVVSDMSISDPGKPDLAGCRNSNLTRAGFAENLFSVHRTIRLMKLMAPTILSAKAVQFSASFVTSLFVCFDEICGTAINVYFYVCVALTEIANTPVDRSAALVLSVIN